MKKNLFLAGLILLAFTVVAEKLSAQTQIQRLNRAKTITTKGFIDKKSTFNPTALDSLIKCDDFVMLISSYEGCGPCEILRTSDVFERFPITPYYTDYLLNRENETVPYTFSVSGFPTCMFFDKIGEIVAVTLGGCYSLYEKIDRIIKGEKIVDQAIPGVPNGQMLPFINCMYKANAAYMKGNMENLYKYATEAMSILPNFYNRYLLYKYYVNKKDSASANKYKELALANKDRRDEFVFKKLIEELKSDLP